MPAIPARPPETANTSRMLRAIRMPAYFAARGLSPISRIS